MIGKLKQQRFILTLCLVFSIVLHLLYGLEGMKQTEELEEQLEKQAAKLMDKQEQIEVLEIIIENQKTEPQVFDELKFIGIFTVTHYCPCEQCCGKSDGITSTGVQAQEGKTVAVDPEVIPLGSTIIMNGAKYIAEDIGGAIKGNRLDVFMNSHQAALNAGVIQAEVYIGGIDGKNVVLQKQRGLS